MKPIAVTKLINCLKNVVQRMYYKTFPVAQNRKRFFFSIRTKLIASFLIMILPIFLLGYISQKLVYNSIKDKVILSTTETIKQTTKHMNLLFNVVKDEYMKITGSSEVQDFYNRDYEEINYHEKLKLKMKANNYLIDRSFSSSTISNIWILDKNDNSLGTGILPGSFDYERFKKTKWYIDAISIRKKPIWVGLHPELDKDGVPKSYAISLIGGIKRFTQDFITYEPVGLLIVDIDIEYINNMLVDIDLGDESEIHLISPDGRDISSLKNGETSTIIGHASFEKIVSGTSTRGYQMIEYKKQPFLMVYEKVENTGYIIVGLQPESVIVAETNKISNWAVRLILLSLVVAVALGLLMAIGIGGPISKLTNKMQRVSKGDLDVNISINSRDEMEILGEGFNKMIEELKAHIQESVKNEKTKREMEISLLLSQINPHFIYNTLNTVIYLAREERADDIVRMVESFISILQDSIRFGEEGTFSTVRQEIETVKNYLQIQWYKYPNRFDTMLDVDEELLDHIIPKTILQPIVENAIFHGICAAQEKGRIVIVIKKEGEFIEISVEDNGVGMSPDNIKKILDYRYTSSSKRGMRSIGLSNIIERIKQLYGICNAVKIDSELNAGTRISINIPIHNK